MFSGKKEQAYRMVRTLIDTGASITFSTTLDGGWWSTNGNIIMADELSL